MFLSFYVNLSNETKRVIFETVETPEIFYRSSANVSRLTPMPDCH